MSARLRGRGLSKIRLGLHQNAQVLVSGSSHGALCGTDRDVLRVRWSPQKQTLTCDREVGILAPAKHLAVKLEKLFACRALDQGGRDGDSNV